MSALSTYKFRFIWVLSFAGGRQNCDTHFQCNVDDMQFSEQTVSFNDLSISELL